MTDTVESVQEALAAAAQKHLGGAVTISDLKRLTGRSSSESWSFDADFDQNIYELVLRRTAGKKERAPIDKRTEAILQQLAAEKEVPVAGKLIRMLSISGRCSVLSSGASFVSLRGMHT